jgi:hypothetical protein
VAHPHPDPAGNKPLAEVNRKAPNTALFRPQQEIEGQQVLVAWQTVSVLCGDFEIVHARGRAHGNRAYAIAIVTLFATGVANADLRSGEVVRERLAAGGDVGADAFSRLIRIFGGRVPAVPYPLQSSPGRARRRHGCGAIRRA